MLNESSTVYYFAEYEDECQGDAFYFDDKSWKDQHDDAFYFGGDAVSKLTPPAVHFRKLNCLKNDYLTYGSLTAVSAKLAELLQEKIRARFIPMQGIYKGKPYTERQFYLVCLLEHIEPLDLNKSIYTNFTNESTGKTFVLNLDKIVIDAEKTHNTAAFEMNPLGFYLFREDICKAILAAGFKGMSFIPIERYRQTVMEDLSSYALQPL